MRKPIIAGNWKMFKTRDEALFFILKVSEKMPEKEKVDTVVFAQAPLLRCLITRQGEELRIGAQNIFYEDEGAYTGEISGPLLESYNVEYVLIGHSERRQYFHETDEDVNKKIKAAIRNDLLPIVCVGEKLEERENNLTNDVLERQIKNAFKDIPAIEMKDIVIAYEPIWAIGTGKTASAEQADEACGFIRSQIKKLYGPVVSEGIRIQYGGSVKPANIEELISKENIDGALIGGASLDPDQFIEMANAPLKIKKFIK
ncbi:MAG: triose-phosphate isomerase [Candidatus Izemoplasmatales bacterium]|uniref:Triosephosphate isomerase n=1 Tax=Hujiaoplasma nucleasis TaxID=2725268 RepID=A0A7L6N6D9_9MOLU|nr:triose-phosphate isomerase [Hujiaoplasma nucleasis]QLY40064.1 triose-phosphate isomerase [Hujiaoplasma nucleasis]